MKIYYLFCFFIATSIAIHGQSDCDIANSYLVSAYSHVKDSYESNNIDHLKYYANRSLESFKLSKKKLNSCGCKTALELVNKGMELLAKVESAPTFEDGRFYVKRAREISKESVIEIDKCALVDYNDTASSEPVLNDLEQEQIALKAQQEALKAKETQIKAKLAEQNEKVLALKKKQLILSYKEVIVSNIKTYNEALKLCDCNHKLLKVTDTPENELFAESIESIKKHYTNNLKLLANDYLAQLDACSY